MAARGDLHPRFYFYGTLPAYATLLLGWLLPLGDEAARPYVAGRIVAVALGTLTVGVAYLAGRRLLDEGGAIAAALILAVMPGPAVHAHYAAVDVPATFFVSAALLLAARAAPDPAERWLALSGVAAGCAAACKYDAGLVVLAPLAAAVMHRDRGWRAVALGAALALGGAAIAFVAACPYAVLDVRTFWPYLPALWAHTHRGHGLIFEKTGNGFLYLAARNLPVIATIPVLLLAMAGVGRVARRPRPADVVVLVWAAAEVLMLASARVRFLRYALPLAPVLALWAAAGIGALAAARRGLRRVATAIVAAWAFVVTAAHVAVFSRTDPRDAAAAWLAARPQSTVGVVKAPSFYTPPLGAHRAVVVGWSAAALVAKKPQLFVTSEFETREEIRLGMEDAASFLVALDRDYERAAVFENPPALFGHRLGPLFPPHDWLYPFPRVTVYRRRSP